jgi:hypothetical protein
MAIKESSLCPHLGILHQCSIQVGHVSLVMLRHVDLHDLLRIRVSESGIKAAIDPSAPTLPLM